MHNKNKIITYPNKILRANCEPVKKNAKSLINLSQEMLNIMYEAQGIGLAAPQIGVTIRFVVIDLSEQLEELKEPIIAINPEIVSISEQKISETEGCLSIPGVREEISRPDECTVRFIDLNNEVQEIVCKGILNICFQHEIDHLNGILYIDYLSRIKRENLLKKYQKLQAEND